MTNPEPLLHYSLSRDDSQLILNGLSLLPYKDSADLIKRFKAEAERQISMHSMASRSRALSAEAMPAADSPPEIGQPSDSAG